MQGQTEYGTVVTINNTNNGPAASAPETSIITNTDAKTSLLSSSAPSSKCSNGRYVSSMTKIVFLLMGLTAIIVFSFQYLGLAGSIGNQHKHGNKHNIRIHSSTSMMNNNENDDAISSIVINNNIDDESSNSGVHDDKTVTPGSDGPGTVEPESGDSDDCLHSCNSLCVDDTNCNDYCATIGQFCYFADDGSCDTVEKCNNGN